MSVAEIKINELTTLDKQADAFEAVFNESKSLDSKMNSVFLKCYELTQERKTKGNDTPLSSSQVASLNLQMKLNKRAEARSQIRPGVYGTVRVGEAAEEQSEEQIAALKEKMEREQVTTSYIAAQVIDGNLVFEKESELGWIPSENLDEGSTYMVEFKTQDGVSRITNMRLSNPVADGTFKKTGDAAEFTIPDLFSGVDRSVRVPAVDPSFYIQPHLEQLFTALFDAAQYSPQKLLISGPQGTGKTTIIQQLAARRNYNFFGMSCGMIESPAEWFGFRTVEGEEIVYKVSAFIEACETPNTVILLDEFNRLHSSLQNGLYNILDDNGAAWIDLIKRNVRVASNVVFVATANIGMAHTGTFQIDAAMEDRFAFHLKMDYLPEADEIRVLHSKTGLEIVYAEKLVKIANKIREQARAGEEITKPISFRQLESAGKLIVTGMRPLDAMRYTIIPKYSDEGDDSSEQATVLKICQGIFGASA